jgi:hypothetical protein
MFFRRRRRRRRAVSLHTFAFVDNSFWTSCRWSTFNAGYDWFHRVSPDFGVTVRRRSLRDRFPLRICL